MIRLEKVTKSYDRLLAVRELTLEVAEGEVCVLIGPSGCGKSTTLRLINRMLDPTSGRVFIQGRDSREFKPALLRRQIGYVIQSVGLFPHMSVAQNIAVVPHLLGWDRQRTERRVEELIGLMGLDPDSYRAKMPHELSGGEAQRIGVARALAADPPILLMDEPFGAVDPLNREVLQQEFIRIQRELRKTVVFVTHDLDEAVCVADSIALMRAGEMVQHDSPETLLARPAGRFARDFVGADRALKRLVRFRVADFMRPAASVRAGESLPRGEGPRYLWVVSATGSLLGWVDRRAVGAGERVEEAMSELPPAEALGPDSTLRTALARMLGEAIKTVPVVNREGQLVGEISLRDIEGATDGAREEGGSP